jgi:nucleotide-binding universal stress UspA family protein
MKMLKNDYGGMDWLDSLKKVKPQQEQEEKLASKTEDEETVESALKDTSNIVFGLPDERTKPEVIRDASRESMEKAASAQAAKEIAKIKEKLSTNGIDPVALGVASKAEWDTVADISKAEQLAKNAALLAVKNAKLEWEHRAVADIAKAKNGETGRSMSYDPQKDKMGRIAPMTGRDDITPFNPKLPKNAASIADPKQIDKMASEPTEHDKAVMSIREDKARKQIEAAKEKYNSNIPDDFSPMKGSAVIHSGEKATEATQMKVPANQISMNDDVSGATPDEIREKLSKLFEERIVDRGQQIRDANADRKNSISRPETKKEMEPPKTPTSTKDMQQRLMELWMPEKPNQKE